MSHIYDDMTEPEKQVADFLDLMGLRYIYESPVFVYDDKKRPRVWTPDFYIPKLGMYIEVCGIDDNSHKWRGKIYKQNEIHVIMIHFYKEEKMWKKFLLARIRELEEQRHEEVIRSLNRLIRFE